MRRISVNSLLVLLGLASAAIIAEGFLRVFAPQPVDYFYFEKSPRPNTDFMRWGVPIHINSAGFRDKEHTREKAPGVVRIAAIGDSITYGSGVEYRDVYHQALETSLNQKNSHYEVLAFNQGATSTDWAVKTYIETARGYRPDIVLLGFCLNDFEDYEAKNSSESKTLRRKAYDLLADLHQYLRVESHLYFFIFERSRRFLYQHVIDRTVRTQDSWTPMSPFSPQHEAIFKRELTSTVGQIAKLNDAVKADGARLLVVIFPFEMQITPQLNALYASEYKITGLESAMQGEAQAALTAVLRDKSIETLDLLPVFRAAAEKAPAQQLYFREMGGMLDWAHPNAVGHRLAAQAIFDRLNEMRK